MTHSAPAVDANVFKQDLLSKKDVRELFRFTIPETLQPLGTQEVGLFQITSDEELMATKRSQNDTHRLVVELARQSLAEVNGKRVSLADGTSDVAWERLHPKIRTLVVTAYGELHAPQQDEVNSFLKSQRVQVG